MTYVAVRGATFAGLFALALPVLGCGDDEKVSADAARPPTVEMPEVECGTYTGDGNLGDYTGDVILRVSVEVTDPNDDVSYVDAILDGAPFRLTPDDAGTMWTYEQGGASNQIARCMLGSSVQVRAVDDGGLVTTVDLTLE